VLSATLGDARQAMVALQLLHPEQNQGLTQESISLLPPMHLINAKRKGGFQSGDGLTVRVP